MPGITLPLLAAVVVVLCVVLAGKRWAAVQRFVRTGGNVGAALVPRLMALATFAAGAILLFSGATPARLGRLGWVNLLLPLPLVELSAYFASVAGAALILLARGLQRRLDAAYHLTLWVLGAGVIFELASALDYEQAVLLSVMLVAFLPSRRFFYRKASLFEERFSREWIVGITGVLLATAVLAYLDYGTSVISEDVFWRFAGGAQAPRAMRALSLALITTLLFSLARLLRPARPQLTAVTQEDAEAVAAIIATAPTANANLALLGDKNFLFDASRRAFIMFGTAGQSRIALGDPVGPTALAAELIERFVDDCDKRGAWPVFYRVGPQLLYLYLDHGLAVAKLGETARVPLADFSLEGPARRNLRRVWRQFVDAGFRFEVVGTALVPELLPTLRVVSDEWLAQKNAREKAFSLGRFDDEFVSRSPVALVRQAGNVIAFATGWLSGEKAEVEVDLMRHVATAPPGIMRYLLVEFMLWAKSQGFASFNLGTVPLAGVRSSSVTPLWNQMAALIRTRGERFYNFQGLRDFKEWFHPEWGPVYLVSPGGAVRPVVVTHVASLISGSVTGLVRK